MLFHTRPNKAVNRIAWKPRRLGLSGSDPTAALRALITSEWRMNEASGNALDSVGSRTLTAANAPGATTGLITGARTLNSASSQQFTRDVSADGPANLAGINFSFSIWFRSTAGTIIVTRHIFGVRNIGSSANHFLIRGENPDTLMLWVGDGNTNQASTNLGAITNNTWHHFAFSFNASTRALRYRRDGGAVTAITTTYAPATAAGKFIAVGGHSANYWTGDIDRIRLYSGTILSDDQLLLDYQDVTQG